MIAIACGMVQGARVRSIRGGANGFSLIELMIAMLLGLMLSEGIYVLLSTSSRANATQLALARLQDSGRVALETIASDLRSAGHMPCGAQLQSQVFSDALATHVIGAPAQCRATAWRDRWPTIPAGPRAVLPAIAAPRKPACLRSPPRSALPHAGTAVGDKIPGKRRAHDPLSAG